LVGQTYSIRWNEKNMSVGVGKLNQT